MTLRTAALLLAGLLVPGAALAQARPATASVPLRMVLNADQGKVTISRHIYGQFAEHLGHGIYEGVWTKSGTGQWHLRDDVIEALRKIQVPNVRWPGGCFADHYHWRDGVGPRDQRPTIVNVNWGNVTEDNSFGTDEYMELVHRLGTEPFIVGNVGSGSVQEMSDWWDYLNFPGTSPSADLRKKYGHEAPYKVKLFGVGNEPWGCGGEMRPEYYADVFKRYANFLSPYGDVRPFRVAAGPPGENYGWTDVMMRLAGQQMDAIDLHYYTIANSWAQKGSATQFTEKEWFSTMREALKVDQIVAGHDSVMTKYDPQKRVALMVGEWGAWWDVEPGTNPGFLYQQNTMRDALVAALSLDIFNRHADRVRFANIAQTINVLQAMILTQGDKMLLTPTYHVFEMYTVHHDATLLPLTFDAGKYGLGTDSIAAVSASASRDKGGVIHITMSNVDPHAGRTVRADLRGTTARTATGRILTASAMNAYNTFEQPNALTPAPFSGARLSGDVLEVRLPPMSIVVLELK